MEPLHLQRIMGDVGGDAGHEELSTNYVDSKDVFISLLTGSSATDK